MGDGNNACARISLAAGVIQLADEACGDTSGGHHLGWGARAIVGTGCLGIVKRMF